MTSQLTTSARRTIAAAAPLLVAISCWLALIHPIIESITSRISQNNALARRLDGIHGEMSTDQRLLEQRKNMLQQLARQQVLWSNPQAARTAATIQDIVRGAAFGSGGRLVSTSVIDQDKSDNFGQINVRARCEGTVGSLGKVLLTIENAKPRLFVTNLSISTVDSASSAGQEQRLSFEMGLVAYVEPSNNNAR